MREIKVENYLTQSVEAVGGLCEKHTRPGKRGAPDRLITWPDGSLDLVETKRPVGGELSLFQIKDHKERAKRHYIVPVLSTYRAVDDYLIIKRRKHFK